MNIIKCIKFIFNCRVINCGVHCTPSVDASKTTYSGVTDANNEYLNHTMVGSVQSQPLPSNTKNSIILRVRGTDPQIITLVVK